MKMKPFAFLLVVLAFCTHCTDGGPSSAIERVKQTNADSADFQRSKTQSLTTPGEYGAQKADLDPETGQFVSRPEPEVPAAHAPIEPSALIGADETMEEKSSPVPGGGMMIDLKGRFQSPISATIAGNGKPEVGH